MYYQTCGCNDSHHDCPLHYKSMTIPIYLANRDDLYASPVIETMSKAFKISY
jgi:hypothetical protein